MAFVRWIMMLLAGEMLDRLGINPRRSCMMGCLFLVPVIIISLFILSLLSTWEQRTYFCGGLFILLVAIGIWQTMQMRRRVAGRLDDAFPNLRRRR
jgi:fucose permease